MELKCTRYMVDTAHFPNLKKKTGHNNKKKFKERIHKYTKNNTK